MRTILLCALTTLLCLFSYGQETYKVIHNGAPGMVERAITFDQNPVNFSNPQEFMKQTFNIPEYQGVKILDNTEDELGFTHYRIQQTINDIPVEGSMYLIHVKNGKVTYANGEWFVAVPQEIQRKHRVNNLLSSDAALEKAKQEVKAEKYAWEVGEVKKSGKIFFMGEEISVEGTLVYIAENNVLDPTKLKLAYKFDMYATAPLQRYDVYIDAINGSTLFKETKIHSADGTTNTGFYGQKNITVSQSGSTYYTAQNGARKLAMKDLNGGSVNWQVEPTNGSFVTSSSSSFNFNGNKAYHMSAYWGMEQTWDMFKEVFNRSSYDGNGSQINLYVNGSGQGADNNAFWANTWTYFGNATNGTPPLTPIDVVAHEIGHGITGTTSQLVYQGQSGALNESFSDIFGSYIEYYVFNTLNENTWTMGDKISLKRSMSNPNLYNQPDTYGGTKWFNTNGCTPSQQNDVCGVHINSGVLNFWFYLVSQGGQGTNDIGNTYTVNGIGIEKAVQIAYRTLVNYLSRNSDYSVARNAVIQAAKDLYGNASCEVKAVTNAMYAVGVGQQYTGGSGDCGNGGGGGDISCEGVPQYVDGQNYQVGDRVISEGVLYERTVSGWDNLGECPTINPTNPCDGVPQYVEGQNYQIGDRIIYQGALYELTVSGWENLGECSSTPPTDPCYGVSQYVEGQNYQVGDRVIYQGSLYELSTTTWINLGPCGATSFASFISNTTSPPQEETMFIMENPIRDGILKMYRSSDQRNPFVIYNMLGKEILSGIFMDQIDVQHVSAGMYFLKTAGKTFRFIKN